MMLLDVERIEQRRRQLGLTMQQAASLAGLPGRSYWADVVSGRKANLTLSTLDAIAHALQLDPRDLLKSPRDSGGSHA